MLADILAAEDIRTRKIKNGDLHPKITEQEVRAMSTRLQETKAFQKMIENGNDSILAKSKDAKVLITELNRASRAVTREADEEKKKKYDISYRQKTVQARCKSIVTQLKKPQTGSYTGLDIIGRRKNTDAYESALSAIEGIGTKEKPTPKEVKSAVETVKEYLKDKMGVRNREFGRKRWENCMKFLKETMPRKEFEEYCKEVNKARGVEKKLSSADYVSPELFGYDRISAKSVLTESKRRIINGKGTEHDYACAIAVRKLYDDGGKLNGTKELTTKNGDYRKLMQETEKILKDGQFKKFMEEIPNGEKQELLKGECDGLLEYDKHIKRVSREAEIMSI